MGPVDIGGSHVDIDEWFGSTVAVGLEANRCLPLIALYIYTTYEQVGSQVGDVGYRVSCIEEKKHRTTGRARRRPMRSCVRERRYEMLKPQDSVQKEVLDLLLPSGQSLDSEC